MFIILGADHGAGKSRYLIRTNILDSKSRRTNDNKTDYGTRTLQFAEIDCKKDVYQIQQKIAPVINEAKKKIESSMLVAVKNENNDVKCIFIPKDAKFIRTISKENHFCLEYTYENTIHVHKLNIIAIGAAVLWTVIPHFKMVVAGDLSFFATSTGRDGHSHCRCTYCPLTASEWSNPHHTPTPDENLLTLSQLQKYASIYSSKTSTKPDTKGVIMSPLLDFEPEDYITPLLHLLIGIVNKGWISMCHFLDEFVENVSEYEFGLKEKILNHELSIAEIIEEVEIRTVNRNMALAERTHDTEAKETYQNEKEMLTKLAKSKKEETKKLRDLKILLEAEKKKRLGDEISIENSLFCILESSNIKKQHFHGGAMNGVCCRRLLDNTKVIFEKVINLVHKKVSMNIRRRNNNVCKLTKVINTSKSLFECMDVVFSKLRILDPTMEEINEMTVGIKGLETLWIELDLSMTPKMHILCNHTIKQVKRFGGIADKVEDFVEKSHQVGNKLDALVARMQSQCFRQQELVKIRRQWLSSDPAVSKQICHIHQSKKRKPRDLRYVNVKETKTKSLIKVKREKRQRVMQTLFDDLDQGTIS